MPNLYRCDMGGGSLLNKVFTGVATGYYSHPSFVITLDKIETIIATTFSASGESSYACRVEYSINNVNWNFLAQGSGQKNFTKYQAKYIKFSHVGTSAIGTSVSGTIIIS